MRNSQTPTVTEGKNCGPFKRVELCQASCAWAITSVTLYKAKVTQITVSEIPNLGMDIAKPGPMKESN